jgi:hypothetical protein
VSVNPVNLRRLVVNMWIFIVPFIVAFVGLGIFINAITFNLLWLWFMVPLGLMPIGIGHSYGLMLIVGFLRGTKAESKGEKEWQIQLAEAILLPVIALVLGFIVKTFFMGF